MTLRGKLISFFPIIHCVLILLGFLNLVHHTTAVHFFILLFVVYLLPVCLFRLHDYYYPLKEGLYPLDNNDYSPWWGSHQLQMVYNSMPFLEAILRFIPGLYSAWLRLWKSPVGKNVYWTPLVEIIDRSLLDVGDNVIFGHRSACCGHVIWFMEGNLALYLKKTTIGSDVLVGAGSCLGPGVVIEPNTHLPVLTLTKKDLHINQENLKEVQKEKYKT